jgi:hypothetical protein
MDEARCAKEELRNPRDFFGEMGKLKQLSEKAVCTSGDS